MKDDHSKKYIICPFCKHDIGKATEIAWFQQTCPECGEELDVKVTKHGVHIDRHREAS